MKKMTMVFVVIACMWAGAAGAAGLDPAVQAKVDAQVKAIQGWAAIRRSWQPSRRRTPRAPADFEAMTQDKWAGSRCSIRSSAGSRRTTRRRS